MESVIYNRTVSLTSPIQGLHTTQSKRCNAIFKEHCNSTLFYSMLFWTRWRRGNKYQIHGKVYRTTGKQLYEVMENKWWRGSVQKQRYGYSPLMKIQNLINLINFLPAELLENIDERYISIYWLFTFTYYFMYI